MTHIDDWEERDADREPDEPDWGADDPPLVGRAYRRAARRCRQQRKAWRKVDRHGRDRFWQVRNSTAVDDAAPF